MLKEFNKDSRTLQFVKKILGILHLPKQNGKNKEKIHKMKQA